MPSALGPWAYISGKSPMAMLQPLATYPTAFDYKQQEKKPGIFMTF